MEAFEEYRMVFLNGGPYYIIVCVYINWAFRYGRYLNHKVYDYNSAYLLYFVCLYDRCTGNKNQIKKNEIESMGFGFTGKSV